MDDHLKTLQIVGFKNSGKTAFIEKLVSACREAEQCVGVVKHHGHGKLDKHDQHKDTGKFRESGAMVTGIAAGGDLEMIWDRQGKEWALEEMIAFYQIMSVDIVLVEGFKGAGLEKIALVRNFEEFKEMKELANLRAIISWDVTCFELPGDVPLFHISEENRYFPWVLSRLGVDSFA